MCFFLKCQKWWVVKTYWKEFWYFFSPSWKKMSPMSKGWTFQKMSDFGFFSITTQFKIHIFSVFALIAQRSKYDFWIPGGILTLEIKFQKNFFFFSILFFFGSKKIFWNLNSREFQKNARFWFFSTDQNMYF